MKGIIPFLTVHGKTGRININAAPKEVLAALPGMDAATVERIIEFRARRRSGGTPPSGNSSAPLTP